MKWDALFTTKTYGRVKVTYRSALMVLSYKVGSLKGTPKVEDSFGAGLWVSKQDYKQPYVLD